VRTNLRQTSCPRQISKLATHINSDRACLQSHGDLYFNVKSFRDWHPPQRMALQADIAVPSALAVGLHPRPRRLAVKVVCQIEEVDTPFWQTVVHGVTRNDFARLVCQPGLRTRPSAFRRGL